jgi:mRNA interferase MazF
MKRGDLVLATMQGDFGKPRPCVVVQTDRLQKDFDSVLVCPLSTHVAPGRIVRIPAPARSTGLRQQSVIMVDKTTAVLRKRIREQIGAVEPSIMMQIEMALMLLLDLKQREL